MYLETMQDILTHSPPLVVDDKLKGLVPFLPLNAADRRAGAATPRRPPAARRRPGAGSTAMNRARHRRHRAAGRGVRAHRSATLFTVDQTEQVLITQFGKPVRVIDEPGPARQDRRSCRR